MDQRLTPNVTTKKENLLNMSNLGNIETNHVLPFHTMLNLDKENMDWNFNTEIIS